MNLIIKRFNELTNDELYGIMQARISVFVVEQKCPYQDLDGNDKKALHVFFEDEGKIQAYLRIFPKNEYYDEVAFSRVITIARKTGLGYKLLVEAINAAKVTFKAERIKIGAQLQAKGFYEKVGFRQMSDEIFYEDDIKHVYMMLELGGNNESFEAK